MTEQLFTREGSTRFTRSCADAKGHPQGLVKVGCGRCGGAGRSDKWAFTGYTCFDCQGSGTRGERPVRLYTSAELAALNERRAKADEKRAAKAQAKAKAAVDALAAAQAARAAEVEASPLFARLSAFSGRSEFVATMLETLRGRDLTEKQEAAALATCDKIEATDAAKAASTHAGTVGERFTFSATVESVRCIYAGTGYYDPSRYAVKLRTDDAKALTWFTSNAHMREGDKVSGTAKVKKHDEYKGEKSTVIQNPRFKEGAA